MPKLFALLALSAPAAWLYGGGVAPAAAGIPGAIPTVRFTYADSYRGWPVAPGHRPHPIRGGFLDARHPGAVFHWGVDVNVRDDRPEPGAPSGRTHRVYAIEGGVVSAIRTGSGEPCTQRFLEVGHFSYWHVDPTVRRGRYVRPGQFIGWTCEGAWHVHLGEWAIVAGRRVWVNPLHAGGKLSPYVDTAAPEIHEISFYTPSRAPRRGRKLDPSALRGVVDVRAWIGDPQSFRGWMTGALAPLATEHHPYEVSVRLVGGEPARSSRWTVFRSDVWFGAASPAAGTPIPFHRHFAPATTMNLKIPPCLRRIENAVDASKVDCKGRQRFRLFQGSAAPYWDTRTVPNGSYRIEVTARDVSGNAANAVASATVQN